MVTGETGLSSLANYGLGGVIFLFMVIPLATLIYRMLMQQIKDKEAEIVRMRASEASLRTTMDAIVPALAEQGRAVSLAIALLNERAKS